VRLRLADGRSAFVKAVGANLNADSVRLYRNELQAMVKLPAYLPAPKLLSGYDDGEWVALIFAEVSGWHPRIPWRPQELARVLGTLADLGVKATPSPWHDAPPFTQTHAGLWQGWRSLAADPPADLDPWLRRHLDQLVLRETNEEVVLQGDTLLHSDVRSDNLFLTDTGQVTLVDWAYTCRGPIWADVALFALTVNVEGGADAQELLAHHPLSCSVAPEEIDTLLLAALGYWIHRCRLPEEPSLPGMRAYQRACAQATLPWVRQRVKW
jgi:hypothetical protein